MIERPMSSKSVPDIKPRLFENEAYPPYATTRRFRDIADMKILNRKCKIFVTGSDQMFNNFLYNLYGKFMVQNFVQDNHWKVAYAASFGHDHIWGDETDRAEKAYFMQKFDRFAVRENVAVNICKNEFGVEATWVLDPVFLCPMERYQQLIEQCAKNRRQSRICSPMFLTRTKKKKTSCAELQRGKSCKFARFWMALSKKKISMHVGILNLCLA